MSPCKSAYLLVTWIFLPNISTTIRVRLVCVIPTVAIVAEKRNLWEHSKLPLRFHRQYNHRTLGGSPEAQDKQAFFFMHYRLGWQTYISSSNLHKEQQIHSDALSSQKKQQRVITWMIISDAHLESKLNGLWQRPQVRTGCLTTECNTSITNM